MSTNRPLKKLGEIIEIQNGFAFDSNLFDDREGFPLIRIRDIKNSFTQTKYKGSYKGEFIVKKGDLLVGMDGEFKCYVRNGEDALLNQRVCRLLKNKEDIDMKFLLYGINSFLKEIEDNTSFVTVKHISSKQIKDIKFPLPPLPTQKLIVAKLDETFAQIDEAITSTQANIDQTDELTKSVLDKVFEEGEWEKVKLEKITSILGDGLHGTPKYDEDGEYYFINGNNLDNGKIVIKQGTKRVSSGEYEKYKKKLNDRTVFVSINGTIGNVAFYNDEKVILGKSACYFNLIEEVNKDYIKYVFMSTYFLDYANKELTGTTIKNVSLKTMRNFGIHLPPLAQQQEIVDHLDRVFAEMKQLKAEYEAKLQQLKELKASVLQSAFEGKLV